MIRKALSGLALMVLLSSAALAGATPVVTPGSGFRDASSGVLYCQPVVRPSVIVRPGPGPCPPPIKSCLNPQPLPPRHMQWGPTW